MENTIVRYCRVYGEIYVVVVLEVNMKELNLKKKQKKKTLTALEIAEV